MSKGFNEEGCVMPSKDNVKMTWSISDGVEVHKITMRNVGMISKIKKLKVAKKEKPQAYAQV